MVVHHFNMRVYPEDTDYCGIVHHAQYLCYMSRARVEWLREKLGRTLDSFAQDGEALILRSAQLEYKRPARLDDLLVVETKITEARKVSFKVEHKIWAESKPSAMICEGVAELVFVDKNLKPRALPEDILAEIHCGS